MSDTTFSLVPVWQIIWAWRKRIIVFVAVVSIATAVMVFFLPKYYLSAVVAVPGNPYLADKGHLFNNNIQGLYSPYGGGDELERLNGIAELDTVYKTVISEFKLVSYYGLPENDPGKSVYKAIKTLREDLRIQQTDKGQLKILMWHKDPQKAAAIVNRVAAITQQMAMDMQVQYNQQSLDNLYATIKSISPVPGDTINYISPSHGGTYDSERIEQYSKIVQELQLAIANNPKALIIQEQGYASGKEDKPKKLPIVASAFFLSLLFAVLTALLYNRKNNHASAV
jgi:uncharacterized protein involved in exopolysaccharide biosynthesis